MNWNNSSFRSEREDFKKLKAVKSAFKARWDDATGDWEDYEFDDEEPELDAWKSESAVKWSGVDEDARETLPGWKTSLRNSVRH